MVSRALKLWVFPYLVYEGSSLLVPPNVHDNSTVLFVCVLRVRSSTYLAPFRAEISRERYTCYNDQHGTVLSSQL